MYSRERLYIKAFNYIKLQISNIDMRYEEIDEDELNEKVALKQKRDEIRLYQSAKNGTIKDCNQYIRQCPKGIHYKEVKERMSYLHIKDKIDLDLLHKFKKDYPNSKYTSQVDKQIAQFHRKEEYNTIKDKGNTALMAFCEKYPNTPEAREAASELTKIMRRDVGAISSTHWFAKGDRDWLDDFYEDARDVMGGGKKFNYFVAGVFRNNSDQVVNIKISMTFIAKYQCSFLLTDEDTYKDVEYLRIYPRQDVPFLFIHKGITEGTRVNGYGCSFVDFSTSYNVEYYPNTISSETLRKQHNLIKQVAENGNIKTKMSPKDNTNKWVDDFFGTSSSGNSEVKVYFYKKNSSSETVKINSNGSTLDKESVSSSGSQTLTFNVKSNQNCQIIIPSVGTINALVKGRITHIIIDDEGEYKIDYQDIY